MNRGLAEHFWMALRLNFRSKQAIVYGYVVPIFFLLAFASVFRAGEPPLLDQMGQLLTITILGGACFGLPTAIVADRERGIWRRYRLLPISPLALVFSTLLARLLIVVSAALLQIALARAAFGTPLPLNLGASAGGLLLVAIAFLGLGLIVAALAKDVPAVQALGQCLFLPMIMIGGVGVPLEVLPAWAQRVAGFMPGRYAVDVLHQAYTQMDGLTGAEFSLAALAAIAVTSIAIGAKLFRWEADRRLSAAEKTFVAAAFACWLVIGATASVTGRLDGAAPLLRPEQVTDEMIATISYDQLTGDDELVTRLAAPYRTIEDRYRVLPIAEQIRSWPPAQVSDRAQRVVNLLCLAAMADVHADIREADIGRVIYEHLRSQYSHAELRRICAWFILSPAAGTVVTTAPEFGFSRELKPDVVRQRAVWYAQKFLGRLTGQLKEPEPRE
jgi:hypothetical protein